MKNNCNHIKKLVNIASLFIILLVLVFTFGPVLFKNLFESEKPASYPAIPVGKEAYFYLKTDETELRQDDEFEVQAILKNTSQFDDSQGEGISSVDIEIFYNSTQLEVIDMDENKDGIQAKEGLIFSSYFKNQIDPGSAYLAAFANPGDPVFNSNNKNENEMVFATFKFKVITPDSLSSRIAINGIDITTDKTNIYTNVPDYLGQDILNQSLIANNGNLDLDFNPIPTPTLVPDPLLCVEDANITVEDTLYVPVDVCASVEYQDVAIQVELFDGNSGFFTTHTKEQVGDMWCWYFNAGFDYSDIKEIDFIINRLDPNSKQICGFWQSLPYVPTNTPTPTNIPTPTNTPTPIFVPTATSTPTPINTLTPTPTATNIPTPTPNDDSYLVFVSSTEYDGDFGGIEGADLKCQDLADNAGLEGRFVAWLSDSNINAKDRLPDVVYRRTDGVLVAENKADLLDGSLLTSIKAKENGDVYDSYYEAPGVWTGTLSNGTRREGSRWIMPGCEKDGNAWTNNSVDDYGHIGALGWTDSRWTDLTGDYCSSSNRFYCFQTSKTGYCPEDINQDGYIKIADLNRLITHPDWNKYCPGCAEDVDGDGYLKIADLNRIITHADWNKECIPALCEGAFCGN